MTNELDDAVPQMDQDLLDRFGAELAWLREAHPDKAALRCVCDGWLRVMKVCDGMTPAGYEARYGEIGT